MSLGHHVVLKLTDGRVIAPTAHCRRIAVERVLAICQPRMLTLFHLVDSHLHLQLLEGYRAAMDLARRLECSLSHALKLDVPFNPAYAKPIADQSHLYRSFDYVLRQQSRHGLDWDPFFEACSVSDLLGLRTLGAYTRKHVRAFLPRITREQLLGHIGLHELQLASGPISLLPEATMAAGCLTDLSALSVRARAAKGAAVAVAGTTTSANQVGRLLHSSTRTIHRMRQQKADPQLVKAIQRQLFFRHCHQRQQTPPPSPPSSCLPLSNDR